MFIKRAKIVKLNTDTIQVQTDNKKDPIDIQLFSQYGINSMPKIGDEVKLFYDTGNKTPIQRVSAIYYNPTIQPTIKNEGDFAVGNFLTKCYLKFFGKNLETSEEIENIKIQPKTELSLKVGLNEFKVTDNGFDMQTTKFNIGFGASYVLTQNAVITAPSGGGVCTISDAGQNIVTI